MPAQRWPSHKLEKVIEVIRNGTTAKQNRDGRGYLVTRIETIAYGSINTERLAFVEIDETQMGKYKMESGDILFSHINSAKHIGKTAIYDGKPEKLVHGMNLLLLRPRKKIIRAEFLHYFLRSPPVRALWRARARRAVNQVSLNQKNIVELDVPVPSLETQHRVMSILERTDRLTRKRAQANEMTNKLLEAVFLQMFGDPLNNRRFETRNLSEIAVLRRGKFAHRPRTEPLVV